MAPSINKHPLSSPGGTEENSADEDSEDLDAALASAGTSVSLEQGMIVVSGDSLTIRCVDETPALGSKKRARFESKDWEELHRDSGRLHQNQTDVDRTSADKTERTIRRRIWDKETGKLLRDDINPLSNYFGHGSAKGQRKP